MSSLLSPDSDLGIPASSSLCSLPGFSKRRSFDRHNTQTNKQKKSKTTHFNAFTQTKKKYPTTKIPITLKKLQKEINQLQHQLTQTRSLNHTIQELHKYIDNPHTLEFMTTQLGLVGIKSKGIRWSDSSIALALSVYHAGAKAYKIFKKIFILPSVSTLKKKIESIKIYPGFSEDIIRILGLKIKKMDPGNEFCSLAMDEMSITEALTYNIKLDEMEGFEGFGLDKRTGQVGNHVLVFFLRGLKTNWKQPIGYFVSSGPVKAKSMKSLLLDCLDLCTDANLVVKCVVSDQGSNNQRLYKLLGASSDTPFFYHKDRKICTFHDTPHLIKNIRNAFEKRGFLQNSVEITWDYITYFYEFEKKTSTLMGTKLTDNHFDLKGRRKLSVKLATQVLSHTVGSGIECLGKNNLYKDATHNSNSTVVGAFIKHFDKLFNCFNSRHFSSRQPLGIPLSANSGHLKFLDDSLDWLETITHRQLPHGPKRHAILPCLDGWKMNIVALKNLWQDLSENCGFKFLFTERLNQDCLENFFSRIRCNGGHVSKPTAQQFRIFYRSLAVVSLVSQGTNSNCESENDTYCINFSEFMKHAKQVPAQPDGGQIEPPELDSSLAFYFEDDANDNLEPAFLENLDPDLHELWDSCGDDGCVEIFVDEGKDDSEDASISVTVCDSSSGQAPGYLLGQNVDNVAELNAVAYTAGYVSRRLINVKKEKKENKLCASCITKLIGEKKNSTPYDYINAKQFDTIKEGGLLYPTYDCYTLIGSMTRTYDTHFDKIFSSSSLHRKMNNYLQFTYRSHIFGNDSCGCHLLNRLIAFFTPMKTKFALKKMNCQYKKKSKDKAF